MYSQKLNLSAFFCIILYLSSLISAFPSRTGSYDGPFSYDYYDTSCPELRTIVRWNVWLAIRNETRMAASLLRLHFHDCFVNGCDGSVLLVDTKTFQGEQNAPINAHSIRGMEIIESIKAEVEEYCPSTVSCADILAIVAREAVLMSGGPHWEVLLGRKDGLTASKEAAMEQLPSTFEPLEKIIAKFQAKGLDLKDMVALSGAHTIGYAQCFIFRHRLYNFKGTGKPDPSLDSSSLKKLQSLCLNEDEKTACNLAALDLKSPHKFDNKYYLNLMKNKGLLQSDQALMSDPRTAELVNGYGSNPADFLNDFAEAMVKMGSIGVITKGGEIRKKCGSVN